jgi:hypothetical protein
MKVCGVELQGNEAVICILSLSDSLFEVSPCRVQRLVVADSYDSAQMKAFQFSFVKLMQDYNVDRVIIRQREMRGKFAGSTDITPNKMAKVLMKVLKCCSCVTSTSNKGKPSRSCC